MANKHLSELLRKSIHISSLVIPFMYRYVFKFNRLLMFIILLATLIFLLGLELYRLQIPTFRKLFHRLFGMVMRHHERRDFTGATFMIFSGLLSVVFFKDMIAFLAMSYLSIGDTFAAIVGKAVGKRKFIRSNKSIEGSLACFTSIMIFAIIFSGGLNPWVYSLGAIAATIAEAWEIPVDDNLKIPIISGIVMTLVHIFV